ncbi:MAG: methylated-DNA--[protein]-cysteine S-methyltransferase [Acidothermaceae bacterium]
MTVYTMVESPIGDTLLVGEVVGADVALTGTYLVGQRYERAIGADWARDDAALRDAHEQLTAYFAGTSISFELPISFKGSEFQRRVWQALTDIPYGKTCTYGELAARVADRTKTRAVAAAVGRNPVGVIVPCHRVIGADGSLTGYAGGLDRKRWLLDHEARVAGLTLAL